jgi:hypothetical protein
LTRPSTISIDTTNNNIIIIINIMASFEDKLQLSFKLPARIHGEPTYATLAELKRTLLGNAASIPCTLGSARHGYLALILSDKAYGMKSNTPFVVPETPPLHPVLPNGATATQITYATNCLLKNKTHSGTLILIGGSCLINVSLIVNNSWRTAFYNFPY